MTPDALQNAVLSLSDDDRLWLLRYLARVDPGAVGLAIAARAGDLARAADLDGRRG